MILQCFTLKSLLKTLSIALSEKIELLKFLMLFRKHEQTKDNDILTVVTTIFLSVLFFGQIALCSSSSTHFLKKGDRSFKEFDNRRAVQYYEGALEVDPTLNQRYEALWKISRSLINVGEEIEGCPKKKINYFERALEYSEKAIEIDPHRPWGYIQRASSNGRIAQCEGIWSSIKTINSVVDDIQKAIELDPENSTAHFMMGLIHLEISEKPYLFRLPIGLGWASSKQGIKAIKKSISLFPPRDPIQVRAHLRLAQAYLQKDKETRAIEELEIALKLPMKDHQDMELRSKAKTIYNSQIRK